MSVSKQSGKIDHSKEGFILLWDKDGLSIEIVDYHVKTLKLSWDTILDLARRAGHTINSAPGAKGHV